MCLFVILLIGKSSEAINLNCQYSIHATNYGPLSRPYQCKASDQPVTGHVNVDSVNGAHQSVKTNDDVKVINVQSIKCARIPSGFENHFKNIEGIFAFSSEKTILLGDDLHLFPKLKYFDISFNRITHLPSDVFQYNPLMEWIDFSDNRIKLVGLNILDPLPNLHYANFATNICINELGRDKTDISRNIKRLLKLNCQPFDESYTGTTPSNGAYSSLYPTLPGTALPDFTTTTEKSFWRKLIG